MVIRYFSFSIFKDRETTSDLENEKWYMENDQRGFNLEVQHQVRSADSAEEGSRGCSAAKPLDQWFNESEPWRGRQSFDCTTVHPVAL